MENNPRLFYYAINDSKGKFFLYFGRKLAECRVILKLM